MLATLISLQADINEQASFHGSETPHTALMFAAWKGRVAIVSLLLGAKADSNARNNEGLTCLDYCFKGQCQDPVASAEIQSLLTSYEVT